MANHLIDRLAVEFERFAKEECHGSSALYEQLSLGVAQDPELLSLAAHARKSERVPNLLFAAVHFSVLKGIDHPLSGFFPSISQSTAPPGDAFPEFRSFCLEYGDKIRKLISVGLVQTNEVRRCASLLPAFLLMARRSQGRPLSLVDIGASAGLNLLWDRYGYKYGETHVCGLLNSPVQITCGLKGSLLPPIMKDLPQVSFRVGVDLNPINVRDRDAILWLRALIWPEHEERAELLEKALQIAQQDPPEIIAGDAANVLPGIFPRIPKDSALCIFRIFTSLRQDSRERLSSLILEEAKKRELYILTARPKGSSSSRLELVSYVSGGKTEELLAYFHNHGEWLEWVKEVQQKI